MKKIFVKLEVFGVVGTTTPISKGNAEEYNNFPKDYIEVHLGMSDSDKHSYFSYFNGVKHSFNKDLKPGTKIEPFNINGVEYEDVKFMSFVVNNAFVPTKPTT